MDSGVSVFFRSDHPWVLTGRRHRSGVNQQPVSDFGIAIFHRPADRFQCNYSQRAKLSAANFQVLAQFGRIIPKYFGDGAEIPVFLTGNPPHRFTQNMAIEDTFLLRGWHVGAISAFFDGDCWILGYCRTSPGTILGGGTAGTARITLGTGMGMAFLRNFTTTPETPRPVLASIMSGIPLASTVWCSGRIPRTAAVGWRSSRRVMFLGFLLCFVGRT